MVTPAPAAASSGTPSELSDDGRTAPTPRTRAHTPTSPAIRSAGIDVGRLAVWSMRSKVTSPMGAVGEAKSTKGNVDVRRSEEHTSELQSLMRISYAVFCLKKKNTKNII